MQSGDDYLYQSLLAGMVSSETLNYLHCQLFDSVCIHMAIFDNCHYDKLASNFWGFWDVIDSFGKCDKLWWGKRASYYFDIDIWMETMCIYRTYHPVWNNIYGAKTLPMDRKRKHLNLIIKNSIKLNIKNIPLGHWKLVCELKFSFSRFIRKYSINLCHVYLS